MSYESLMRWRSASVASAGIGKSLTIAVDPGCGVRSAYRIGVAVAATAGEGVV